MARHGGRCHPPTHHRIGVAFTLVILAVAAMVQSAQARAASLLSADCINCNNTPTADIQWVGSTTDVGWSYVATSDFNLAEIATNFAAGLGADRTVTAEIFQGIPGQPGAALLGSVSFFSALAHGQLGGAPFPSLIPLAHGQRYFIGFLNVGGLGLNVDADNDFQGSSSDPDTTGDTCDGQIPANPACDADGAALRILGDTTVGGLHIDRDGSGTFSGVDTDLAPVALAAPIIDLRAPAPVATPVSGCVGDCNDDLQVTVDEIVTMVNIALGNGLSPSDCEAGDANHDGAITVDEILTAVNNALDGCNPSSTPTPTGTPASTPGSVTDVAASVAGRTTIAIDAATVISSIVAAAANGLQVALASEATSAAFTPSDPGGQAAGACPMGGTATKTGNAIFGETVTFTGCTVATFDGSVIFNGTLSFGLSAPFSANVQATFKNTLGVTIEVANADITGTGAPSVGGTCNVAGISLMLNGSLTRMLPAGPTVGLSFSNTSVVVGNLTFSPSCVPTMFDITLDGDAALLDPAGATQSVTFNQFILHFDTSEGPTVVTVNGSVQSPCFGGTVSLTTETPMSVPNGQDCPTAGVVTAASSSGQATVTFESDGSVVIQGSAGGSLSAPNCFDPRLLMCVA